MKDEFSDFQLLRLPRSSLHDPILSQFYLCVYNLRAYKRKNYTTVEIHR